jgi:short subunit dehydrogenase-like uncharacterized protein
MPTLLIYGATGYTGRLACDHAHRIGLDFIIAGRTEAKLRALATLLKVPYKVVDVADGARLDSSMADIHILLNCAGPFSATAEFLMKACIRNKVHYLDVAAEMISYRMAEQLHEQALDAGVMLLPGCGGSVTMFSSITSYVLENIDRVTDIEVALHVSGPMSRGSAISASQSVTNICLQRRSGALVEADSNCPSQFDFLNGRGSVSCHPVTLPDLITLWRSTGIPNIRAFVFMSGTSFPGGDLEDLPDGPSLQQRNENPYQSAVRITCADGTQRTAVLHTVNGYTFTAMASVEAARRILDTQVSAGFQTPMDVFGVSFVETISGSRILDG